LEPLFLCVVERCCRRRGCTREFRNRCSFCAQDNSAKKFRPFTLCEDWISAALFWNGYSQVNALGHTELKKIAFDRLYRLPINGQKLGFQPSCIDVKILVRGGCDEPEQDGFPSMNGNDFRIIERATVRKEGVVLYVNVRFGRPDDCSNKSLLLIVPFLSSDFVGRRTAHASRHFPRSTSLHFFFRWVALPGAGLRFALKPL